MLWYIYSLIMFISSIIYYLLVKKVQNLKVGRSYMLFNFLVPTLLYLTLILIQGKSFLISLPVLLISIFVGVIFNYVGTLIAYYAIERAPNAGYSLVIQKSYAAYTTIVAIFLFNSEVDIIKFLAIGIILVSIGIVTIERSKEARKAQSGWIIFSILAMLMFGGISLSAKYVVANLGADPTVYLFYVILFTLILSIFDSFTKNRKELLSLSKKQILNLILMGIAVSSFYFFKNLSDVNAPNVGYSNVINASSNAIFTVLVALILKDHLSVRRFLGVLGVIAGLIILFL